MIPVYLFTCAVEEDKIRWHLFQAVLARWMAEPGIELTVVTPYMVSRNWEWPLPQGVALLNVGTERRNFFGNSVLEVQRVTSGDWMYTVDDEMPILEVPVSAGGKAYTAMGMAMLDKFTEFAILGTRFCVDTVPPDVDPYTPYPVVEPGCPMFVRKGAWPESIRGLMNRDFESFAREHHIKMGNIPWLLNNHIGWKLSTSWPDDYKSGVTQV